MPSPSPLALAVIVAALSLNPLFGAEPTLLAPGASVEKLSGGFAFTEGPATDSQGHVFFTDQPNDRIVRWDAITGVFTDWMKPAGRANGMYFDARGHLIACADGNNELWSIAPDKSVTVLAKDHEGKLFNGPNDVWIRPDGGLYFTDPFYKRNYWNRGPSEIGGQHVYFMPADRSRPRRVTDDLRQPNGLIGTPDGKTLYVADIGAGKTYRYEIQPDGVLTGKHLFCEQGSDGMTLDARGNVYLTGKGVTVYNPQGTRIEQIPIPEGWTANVCFGGTNRNFLFITAGTSVYGAKMSVRGAH